jgi:hypothetical protein
MPNPITTSGLSSGDVSTQHQSGQTTSEWIEEHLENLDAESPAGDTLTTTWTSGAGREQKVTQRQQAESDKDFIQRHRIDFLLSMIEAPPAY